MISCMPDVAEPARYGFAFNNLAGYVLPRRSQVPLHIGNASRRRRGSRQGQRHPSERISP